MSQSHESLEPGDYIMSIDDRPVIRSQEELEQFQRLYWWLQSDVERHEYGGYDGFWEHHNVFFSQSTGRPLVTHKLTAEDFMTPSLGPFPVHCSKHEWRLVHNRELDAYCFDCAKCGMRISMKMATKVISGEVSYAPAP